MFLLAVNSRKSRGDGEALEVGRPFRQAPSPVRSPPSLRRAPVAAISSDRVARRGIKPSEMSAVRYHPSTSTWRMSSAPLT
jgi:hypothetical protein